MVIKFTKSGKMPRHFFQLTAFSGTAAHAACLAEGGFIPVAVSLLATFLELQKEGLHILLRMCGHHPGILAAAVTCNASQVVHALLATCCAPFQKYYPGLP